tara:strand:- start:470 stop:622 length:153 start_codon:yes stop_codon:yes gene_type:complete
LNDSYVAHVILSKSFVIVYEKAAFDWGVFFVFKLTTLAVSPKSKNNGRTN